MENEIKNKNTIGAGASIVIAALILGGAWIYKNGDEKIIGNAVSNSTEEKNLYQEKTEIPVRWGDLGIKMLSVGVIDAEKFESLYANRGGLPEEIKQLLYNSDNGNLKITQENSGAILNLLWVLGLGNKNLILEQGPMNDFRYGGAQNFASTNGWTLAKGETMEHYSRHPLIILSKEQQELVERTSKNIYRPCCGNSTYFPDCNHGMAMLGLLELMASQGFAEEGMYKYALIINSYWFPDTYLTIAKYFAKRGVKWENINPKEILGADYSSIAGYSKIIKEVEHSQFQNRESCGI